MKKDKCPGCKEANADYRQPKRPDLCAWCGYNHATGEVAGFVPASDPFDDLFPDSDQQDRK